MTEEQYLEEIEQEFEKGFKEGFKKGFKEAYDQGRVAVKKYIIKKFLPPNLPLDTVNKMIDSSMEEFRDSIRLSHYLLTTNSISFLNNEYLSHLQ